MTGEISLQGHVLPIGGVKEKLIAAHRAGMKDVFLPEENRKDLREIPDEVKADLSIHFVSKIDEILGSIFKPKFKKHSEPLSAAV